MSRDVYAPGDWNSICYTCGRKFKASELKLHWQGYYVCSKHWEARHPQDFVRAPADVQTPPWTQPTPAPIFVGVCDLMGREGIVGFGTVGCMVVNLRLPSIEFDPTPLFPIPQSE